MSVIVYSKTHCIECNILKRFLQDHQIQFELRDCNHNPKYLDEVKEMGYLGVPVTLVHGEAIRGLQPELILETIQKHTTS